MNPSLEIFDEFHHITMSNLNIYFNQKIIFT